MLARAGQANRFDKSLLAKVAKVARARISRAIVVAEITTGDDSKRADSGQPRFGPAQGVLAVAIADDLPLQTAWQVNVPYERITWVSGPFTLITVAVRPTCVITAIVLVRMRGSEIVPRTAAECSGVIIAMSGVGLPSVIIAVEHVGPVAAHAIALGAEPFVVTRVGITRIKIHQRPQRLRLRDAGPAFACGCIVFV